MAVVVIGMTLELDIFEENINNHINLQQDSKIIFNMTETKSVLLD